VPAARARPPANGRAAAIAAARRRRVGVLSLARDWVLDWMSGRL
jgi:hypothetical protein